MLCDYNGLLVVPEMFGCMIVLFFIVCAGCTGVDWVIRNFLIKLCNYRFCWKMLEWFLFLMFWVAAVCLYSFKLCFYPTPLVRGWVVTLIMKYLLSVNFFFCRFIFLICSCFICWWGYPGKGKCCCFLLFLWM